jgi:hypothetical protein
LGASTDLKAAVAASISMTNYRICRRCLQFGNRELRRIFGTNRDKVTEDWRKLHSGELHNLY